MNMDMVWKLGGKNTYVVAGICCIIREIDKALDIGSRPDRFAL